MHWLTCTSDTWGVSPSPTSSLMVTILAPSSAAVDKQVQQLKCHLFLASVKHRASPSHINVLSLCFIHNQRPCALVQSPWRCKDISKNHRLAEDLLIWYIDLLGHSYHMQIVTLSNGHFTAGHRPRLYRCPCDHRCDRQAQGRHGNLTCSTTAKGTYHFIQISDHQHQPLLKLRESVPSKSELGLWTRRGGQWSRDQTIILDRWGRVSYGRVSLPTCTPMNTIRALLWVLEW